MGAHSCPFPQTSDLPSRVPILSDKGVGGWTSIHKHWDANYWKHDMNRLDQQTRSIQDLLFLENPRIDPKWNAETPWLMGKETSLFSCKSNKQLRGWYDLLSRTPVLQDRAHTPFCLCPFTPPSNTVHPIVCIFLKKIPNVTTCSFPWSFICSSVGSVGTNLLSHHWKRIFLTMFCGEFISKPTPPPISIRSTTVSWGQDTAGHFNPNCSECYSLIEPQAYVRLKCYLCYYKIKTLAHALDKDHIIILTLKTLVIHQILNSTLTLGWNQWGNIKSQDNQ